MADTKITALPAATTAATTDILPIVASPASSPVTKKITKANFLGISGNVVGDSDTQTLTSKTLTAPIIATISNTGTLTLPTSTDTLVGRATTDTLTNKTLTSPIIASISNTGTITLPTATDTLVGKTTTDTFTNKTITDSTNNVMAKSLKSATTTVDVSAATAPTSGQVLTATSSTAATWQSPSISATTAKARVNRTSAQSISNTTVTKIQFNVKDYDPGSNFDAVTNFRFTCPVTGYYFVHLQITIASMTSGHRVISYIYKNNAEICEYDAHASFTQDLSSGISTIISCTATDYIEGFVYQDNGGSLNTVTYAANFMDIHLLST